MSEDKDLQQAVLAELSWEPSVLAAHIAVSANAGVVTLTGHVESYAQKHAAENAASRVKGVISVAGQIEVRLPFNTQRRDDEIAAAALERLAWDVSIPRNAIKVRVENGWLTLTGEVSWDYQKKAAEEDVRRLFGVRGVSNQTTIKPRLNTVDLSNDIIDALHRSWYFDPKSVNVSAEGGKIRLTGWVHSPHHRQAAASVAWAAPGAVVVENDIAIV